MTDKSPIQHALEVAKAATPGLRQARRFDDTQWVVLADNVLIAQTSTPEEAEIIAMCDPETVTALLEAVAVAKEFMGSHLTEIDRPCDCSFHIAARRVESLLASKGGGS